MKSIKGLLFMLLALAVIFTFGQPAWAAFGSASSAGGTGGIQVDDPHDHKWNQIYRPAHHLLYL